MQRSRYFNAHRLLFEKAPTRAFRETARTVGAILQRSRCFTVHRLIYDKAPTKSVNERLYEPLERSCKGRDTLPFIASSTIRLQQKALTRDCTNRWSDLAKVAMLYRSSPPLRESSNRYRARFSRYAHRFGYQTRPLSPY
ncbi:hypothetical protein XMD579_000626 [Marinobacterium sp. xm-d-579]|nr:hypothetical protein [Marinobacterium sp. xm-d-579]